MWLPKSPPVSVLKDDLSPRQAALLDELGLTIVGGQTGANGIVSQPVV
jgi:hypothetical protein